MILKLKNPSILHRRVNVMTCQCDRNIKLAVCNSVQRLRARSGHRFFLSWKHDSIILYIIYHFIFSRKETEKDKIKQVHSSQSFIY